MKLTPWMLTVAAFGIIALLAVGFLFKKLWATEVVEAPKPESRLLPMAVMDLEPGTVITRAHIGNGPWTKEGGEKLEPDTLLSIDGILGRIVKEPIMHAKPLRGSSFYAPGDQPDQKVAEGKRAVSIRVSDTTATLLKKLKPEQYVDVQLTVDRIDVPGLDRIQASGGRSRNRSDYDNAMTLTLFKGVKIVSLTRSSATDPVQSGTSQNVTLELDEIQARIALLAQMKGQIDLVYNPSGPGTGGIEIKSEKDRVTLHELLGLKEAIEKDKPFRTEHYHGVRHSSSYFRDGERVSGNDDDAGDDADPGGGIPPQDNSDDWTTDTNPTDRNKAVARQQPQSVSSDL